MGHRQEKDSLVDPELFVYVYQNLGCSPDALREHFMSRQASSEIAYLCEEHANGLVFLFARAKMLCLSPVA